MTIVKLTKAFLTTGLDLGNTLQLIFAVLLLILGVLVAIQGVKKLLEKGFLSEVGFVRCGKTYARTFRPAISRVEYWAEVIRQENLTRAQVSELKRLLSVHYKAS